MSLIVRYFPAFAIALSMIAMMIPNLFINLKSTIIPLLMIIMLSMGLTLSATDFRRALQNKVAILIGIALQFSVMPLLAFVLSQLMSFNDELLIGMVLVGTVAGGTASNVMCYLAKGDVALSISMTAISTLVGVLFTPLLTTLFIGQVVNIDTFAMLKSLLQIVLLPVGIGLLLNTLMAEKICKVSKYLPTISVLAITVIIAIIVALSHDKLLSVGTSVLMAVVLHNTFGLVLGYLIPKLLKQDEKTCRTIAFEVGMQNSGLAVALAMKFFTPASAIAGTIFSIWHNVSGSLLAGYWSKNSHKSIK